MWLEGRAGIPSTPCCVIGRLVNGSYEEIMIKTDVIREIKNNTVEFPVVLQDSAGAGVSRGFAKR